mmetsp:Transcript_42212/g.83117  ORF Transcript_42212/g.83117 Transcript_42212/m.83117 type:complete len:204 (-) Transcript_42212:954-1565(-)
MSALAMPSSAANSPSVSKRADVSTSATVSTPNLRNAGAYCPSPHRAKNSSGDSPSSPPSSSSSPLSSPTAPEAAPSSRRPSPRTAAATWGYHLESCSTSSAYASSRESFTITSSMLPFSRPNSISPLAAASRSSIFSGVSVPRWESRDFKSARVGGAMKMKWGCSGMEVDGQALTLLHPCTSMSRMHTFPSPATSFTEAKLVP